MRKKIVAGNWKMNGCLSQVIELSQQLNAMLDFSCTAEVVVMPPVIYLPIVQHFLNESKLHLGAQNVYPKDFGAHTGEISGLMLQDFGVRYVLVGHSERRHEFDENENFVAQKFHHVKDHDMIPVLCVGETLAERESGKTWQVIEQQLLAVSTTKADCFQNCIIAYEPVWAIGTGKTASPEQAQEVHQYIRTLVAQRCQENAEKLPVLYGGSVNETNAKALFSMPDVDGGLVGGASLNAKQFVEIVKCIN